MSFLTEQLKYDSMLPADDPVAHSYTGEVDVDGYTFVLEDGEFISVIEDDISTPFCQWAGADRLVEQADYEAQQLWLAELLESDI
jgi:hypothetical protein